MRESQMLERIIWRKASKPSAPYVVFLWTLTGKCMKTPRNLVNSCSKINNDAVSYLKEGLNNAIQHLSLDFIEYLNEYPEEFIE